MAAGEVTVPVRARRGDNVESFPLNKEIQKEKEESHLPHYMVATAASKRKQQPAVVRRVTKKTSSAAVRMNGDDDL